MVSVKKQKMELEKYINSLNMLLTSLAKPKCIMKIPGTLLRKIGSNNNKDKEI